MAGGIGIPEKHPEFLAMTAAIFSPSGEAAAVAAAAEGRPALFGLDQMLTETFVRYRDKNPSSLQNAGFIVARLMRDKLGYTQGKLIPCPEGYTVQSGTMF
ncbi:hypothetical protein [Methylobacterium sp. 1973]|uniref:hypothetical protein n=1 Tax=Methylobacterium sp. 1973 TaxID=3156421 RepID=UPI003390E148